MKRTYCFVICAAVFLSACTSIYISTEQSAKSTPTITPTVQPSSTPAPTLTATPIEPKFSFKPYLSGALTTLSAQVESIDLGSKQVTINGVDTSQPLEPFTFDWGNGQVTTSWFPATYTYQNTSRNYVVQVKSGAQSVSVPVVFVPVSLTYAPLPDSVRVSIPNDYTNLQTRLYGIGSYSYFDDSYFTQTSRQDIEYLLWVSAAIQYDLVNQNVFMLDGDFQQVVLRDPQAGGMYSLWFTSPVSFASADYGFTGTPQYSSFFHEMGHNFTLNSPSHYYYGGKIDGNANAIYSETMANIFAQTTAYEILNHVEEYGIDAIIALDIQNSAVSSFSVTRQGFENYIAGGTQFHSWNNPDTQEDETFDTFMTLAYMFCLHADESENGYRISAQRMMRVLQKFNPDWLSLYSPRANSTEAESFRATLMVAAMSYGFNTDLREDFRNLGFPVNDDSYTSILGVMEDS
ncbi:MAG: hypothetical protein ACK2TV_04995 [Anaerolineales bacterium]|jgi:hypothetical protein